MNSYTKLLDGYREFQRQYWKNFHWRDKAKNQQHPKVMIIACSDSRVNPAILTGAGLGEIFMVNNVANLVPPYKQSGNNRHSTCTAIEYAVTELRVRHIIVMGHSNCGGIHALLANHGKSTQSPDAPYSFIRPWMSIVDDAAGFATDEKSTIDSEQIVTVCARRACLTSRNNLRTFPWVQAAMRQDTLQVHAWYFDIGSGILEEYDETTGQFQEIDFGEKKN